MCWRKKQILPHPEEPMNPSATLENTDIKWVVKQWLYDWGVPVVYYPFWQGIDIKLDPTLSNPAATFSETKRMYVNPKWANPGVIAHECGHISYSLLTEGAKFAFETSYTLLDTDPLLRVLHSQNSYMNTNIVETHAECYRFLGQQLPGNLKRYYPQLF